MENYFRTLDVRSRDTVQQNRMTFWQDNFGGDDKCAENVNDRYCGAFAKQNRSTNENDNRKQRRATIQNFEKDQSSGDESEVDTDEQEESASTKESERLIADTLGYGD